jgi:multiple sugar transport system substrate-binding protein
MRRGIAGVLSLGAWVLAAMPAMAQDKTLTVWFSKGFYRSEDESLWATIKKFEQKTGIKVELSQYAIQDMIPKTVAALDSGSPPDVGYSDTYNNQAAGKWAFEGKLEDLTDILQPMMSRFAPQTVEHVLLMNGQTQKKAYYGFPLKRQTLHTETWGDMLEKAGFKPSDVPTKWADYWAFWCDKVQPAYRKASGTRTYGIGAPMGVESTDSFQSFYAFMDAYDAKLVDSDGKLTVDDPKTREGVVKALKDYTDPYVKGCVPPSATTWKDPDNNVAFHNRTTVMTHNFTISIAAKWYEDSVNPNNTPEQREASKKAYEETIITAPFPNRPPRRRQAGRRLLRRQEQGGGQGVREVHHGGGQPPSLRRGRDRPLVPGHEGVDREPVLAGRQAPQGGLQPVQVGHRAVRLREELQGHAGQQRDRLRQGDEPGGEREGPGREGGRRDARPHQADRRAVTGPSAARPRQRG